MSKDLSAKYYHKNKEMLLSENKMYPDLLGEEKDKKKLNMVANDIKVSQRIKDKG